MTEPFPSQIVRRSHHGSVATGHDGLYSEARSADVIRWSRRRAHRAPPWPVEDRCGGV